MKITPKPRRFLTARLSAALAVAAAVLTVVPTAAFADHGIYTTATVNIRSGPTTGYAIIGSVPANTSPTYLCWTEGQNINGVTVWFKVNHNGTVGYISSYYDNSSYTTNAQITTKYGIPNCSTQQTTVPPGTYITSATQVRYCVDLAAYGCTVLGPTIGTNAPVAMQCWKDSSGARWFYVQSSAGVVGFVRAGNVGHQSTVGACSSNKRVTASEVAASRANEKYARSADLALFAGSEWAPGPVGEWAGDCPKLPYVGWRAAGISIRKNDAITNYRAYASAGAIRTGAAPAGAVVYYNITSWGHTAVSLGNGMVATTRGLDGSGQLNAIVPSSTFANYLGYYLPA